MPVLQYCMSATLSKSMIIKLEWSENLNRMREIQFRETSADTERIKYNTNGIKTWSSKKIDFLKVKRRHSWIQWSNEIQQHFCWDPVNHCYKCTKRKIFASKHEKIYLIWENISRNIGQYVYYNCLLARLWHHKVWN